MKTFYWVKVTHNDIKLDVCKLRNGEQFIDKGIFLAHPDEMLDTILNPATCAAIYRSAENHVANKLKKETPIPLLKINASESDAPPF